MHKHDLLDWEIHHLMIFSRTEKKVNATYITSIQDIFLQLKKLDRVVEEYKDRFTSPSEVPLHFQVKHSIDLIPSALFPMAQYMEPSFGD